MFIAYLFPLLIVAGFAYYYLSIYKKGKAAGGGMMAGFQAAAEERWKDVLEPGEAIIVHGSGVKWRPSWQAFLAGQMPIFRLVWPQITYAFAVTSRNRVLTGRYGALGGIGEQKAHPKNRVRVDRAEEEQPGLALKLNPLYQVQGAYKTYDATLVLSEETVRVSAMPGPFLDSVRSGASQPF